MSTEAFARGWRAGIEAFREALERGTVVRPTYRGLTSRDQLATPNPIMQAGEAQEFSGFLQGWLRAEEMVHETLKALEGAGP